MATNRPIQLLDFGDGALALRTSSLLARFSEMYGKRWTNFDAKQEWVRMAKPSPGRSVITAKYDPVAK